jgi:hypothetical protein
MKIETKFLPRRSRLPAALALVCAGALAGTGVDAATSGDVASSPSTRYTLHMAQRTERLMQPAHRRTARVPFQPSGVSVPVTSCADDGSDGTLRSVITSAVEGETVDLTQLPCSTITLTQGLIDMGYFGPHQVYDLAIAGPGADQLTIDGNGGQVFSAGGFYVGRGTLAISDVTIANGNYTHGIASCVSTTGNLELTRTLVTDCHASGGGPLTFGGAIDASYLTMTSSAITNSSSAAAGDNVAIGGGAYVPDDATLVDSTISGNSVTAETAGDPHYLTAGGGLYVRGALSMTTSTISGNELTVTGDEPPTAQGGGIFVRGDVTIDASTFSDNAAPVGGGLYKAIYSVYGDPFTTMTITNSTFSHNSAMADGSAIVMLRPTTISNSTIASNGSTLGLGGVSLRGADAALTLQSTIIAMNSYGDGGSGYLDLTSDTPVTIAGGSNLVMVAAGVTLPEDTLADDPLLSPLADNGGPTMTMALDPTSPAINAGNNLANLDDDQRGDGFPRVFGPAADIGAFELQEGTDTDTIFKNGFD